MNRACVLCGGRDWHLRFPDSMPAGGVIGDRSSFRCTHSGYGVHPAIFQCTGCRLLSLDGVSESEILAAYKDVEDPVYLQEEPARRRTFERRMRRLERFHPPPGRLLDVGAYTGAFVEVAGNRGWTAMGVEPSRWAVANARSRGLSVVEGVLDSAPLAPESFDVVTMWDVIEHVADPVALLRSCARVLKAGGLAVVHTMDARSVTAAAMRGRWPWLMEMHLHYFSRSTLALALRKTGFRVRRVFAEGRLISAGYLASRVGGLLGERVGRVLGRAIGAAGAAEVLLPVNFGDLMTVYAVKESPSSVP